MRKCPGCSEEIQDDAKICRWCHSIVEVPVPGAKTSGKAIASLVLGIIPVIPIVGSILAIIFGRSSRREIRQSGGRLKGEGIALAGFVLGIVQIAITALLILAAIVIPNLLRTHIAANQASAVGSLRAIATAEVTYSSIYNRYSPTLSALGPPASGSPDVNAAGLINSELASGVTSGYMFTYEVAGPGPTGDETFTVRSDPAKPGATGQDHYFVDQTGVIRWNMASAAGPTDPPIR